MYNLNIIRYIFSYIQALSFISLDKIFLSISLTEMQFLIYNPRSSIIIASFGLDPSQIAKEKVLLYEAKTS